MTNGDFQFMKEMGIEPCGLDDQFPNSLPPPPPPEAPIPRLTEEDARWLQNLGVLWGEPGAGLHPAGDPTRMPDQVPSQHKAGCAGGCHGT